MASNLRILPLPSETPKEALARWEKDGICDSKCLECKPYYDAVEQGLMPWSVFQPSHKASAACRSGGHNHCTCNSCF